MEVRFHTVMKNGRNEEVKEANGTPFTLGRMCEIALDTALESDRNEGLKPKLKRGRLLEEILAAEAGFTALKLEAGDVELLKTRIAHTFTAASMVRAACLLLDPDSKE